MAIIEIPGQKSFYLDNIVKKNLDIYLDSCQKNDDLVIGIDGPEGAGKSLLARQIGAYCAHYLGTQFDVDNIHFDLKEYVDFSIDKPDFTVCILDEARNVLNRKAAMSKGNRKFTNFLSECRKFKQIHIIVLPTYHDLDKYVVLWRMKFLLSVSKWFEEDKNSKSGYSLKRGSYKMFMNDDFLKKFYELPYFHPKVFETKAQFKNVEVVDVGAYDAKKSSNLEQKYHSKHEEEKITVFEKMWRQRFFQVCEGLIQNRNIKKGELCDYANIEVTNYESHKSKTKYDAMRLKA